MNSTFIEGTEMSPFHHFGEQLMAVLNGALSPGNVDERLHIVNALGASEDIPSDGGFLVQSDFTTKLLEGIITESLLARECLTIPTDPRMFGITAPIFDETSRATGSRLGGVQVYRTAESLSITSKKPKFRGAELNHEKLMGICHVTEEMFRDIKALGAIIGRAFSSEFAFVIDDEIINGTGVGQCLGILNSDALIVQEKETGQPSASIYTENITKMLSRMWSRGLSKCKWYINAEILPQLLPMQIGDKSIYDTSGDSTQVPIGKLLGRPIVPIEQCAALGDVGDIVLADLSQYLLIEKDGIKTSQSLYVQYLTDEMAFKFTLYNNGQPLWKSPIMPFKGTQTVSPFVALEKR